ncbi:hypothetical protein K9M41_01910 [Candidatus Gracilibacteria bacterium]|nr:hypothetical protein [Candidatus Gracilibacteria bacterium]
MSDIYVSSETGKLYSVILGRAETLNLTADDLISFHLEESFKNADLPKKEKAIAEFTALGKILKERGVEVFRPDILDTPEQLNTRDIGFVIQDTFFVSHMKVDTRQDEIVAIERFIKKFPKVVRVPEGVMIEGGDIVVDKGHVFIGVGVRTNEEGMKWLKNYLEENGFAEEFKIVPVFIKKLVIGEILHLDCAFMPVGEDLALIYLPAFAEGVPAEIIDNYRLIEVTEEEQRNLGTNVLSLDKCTVISRPESVRINGLLEKEGIKVIPLSFNENPKTGGSFRCATLPLVRK